MITALSLPVIPLKLIVHVTEVFLLEPSKLQFPVTAVQAWSQGASALTQTMARLETGKEARMDKLLALLSRRGTMLTFAGTQMSGYFSWIIDEGQ